MSGEAGGGIAGSLKDNGTMYGNYYVEGGLDGVDGIGYENGACPISYEELSNMENVPDAFTYFTVTFMADDKEVAKINCTYGSRLSDLDLPEVPEKKAITEAGPKSTRQASAAIPFSTRNTRNGLPPLPPRIRWRAARRFNGSRRILSGRMLKCHTGGRRVPLPGGKSEGGYRERHPVSGRSHPTCIL